MLCRCVAIEVNQAHNQMGSERTDETLKGHYSVDCLSDNILNIIYL